MSRAGRFGPDAPDGVAYLPLAGGEMTGDITMAGAQKVDGIDISTHAADLDAHTRNIFEVVDTAQYICSVNATPSDAEVALVANKLYFAPLVVARKMTLDRIAIFVHTLADGTSIRLGIYNLNATLQPSSLVLDAGVVDASTTGLKEITISQQLTKGIYALAFVSDGTPSIHSSSGGGYSIWGCDTGLSGYPRYTLFAFQAYGALPATAPAITSYSRYTYNIVARASSLD